MSSNSSSKASRAAEEGQAILWLCLLIIRLGAEAIVYRAFFLDSLPSLLKHRPKKTWRHPTLDARLTKHRIFAEARLLQKCRKLGIPVPAVYFLDEARGDLWMEWIDGSSVRDVLYGSMDVDVDAMMESIGRTIAALHAQNVVHGDLTTSNLMRRGSTGTGTALSKSPIPSRASTSTEDTDKEGEIVLIDFGLGTVSCQDEDKAVDLYVLERAFLSSHPDSEGHFRLALTAYGKFGGRRGATVLSRLEDVRLRGRKRSMVG